MLVKHDRDMYILVIGGMSLNHVSNGFGIIQQRKKKVERKCWLQVIGKFQRLKSHTHQCACMNCHYLTMIKEIYTINSIYFS